MVEIAPSQIYTIRDVAEYFKCSTRKVHRLMATGQLRGFKIGNQRRFKGDEILQFIERQDGDDGSRTIAPTVHAERLYSLREVSAILQVPMNEVAHMLREGRLSGFRVGMEWRCWGRDLLKLVPSLDVQASDEALQPSLLETHAGEAPSDEELLSGTADKGHPIEPAA